MVSTLNHKRQHAAGMAPTRLRREDPKWVQPCPGPNTSLFIQALLLRGRVLPPLKSLVFSRSNTAPKREIDLIMLACET